MLHLEYMLVVEPSGDIKIVSVWTREQGHPNKNDEYNVIFTYPYDPKEDQTKALLFMYDRFYKIKKGNYLEENYE